MWLAGRALGAPDGAEHSLRAYGWAAAAASYLQAVPELEARGRQPLPQGTTPQDLARLALVKLAAARQARPLVPKEIAPAFLAGWQAESLLRQVVKTGRCDAGLSEFQRRWRLLRQAFTGRW